MILVDFSSIIHRMVFSASKEPTPREKNGKYITSDFSGLMLYNIINELVNVQLTYQADYGEMVILFDDWRKDYWRKDVFPGYKAHRNKARAETKINYAEVYAEVNELVEQLEKNTPWRCVTVNRAEADDTMLILSREFCENEDILIYSPDKDMIQAQRWTDRVSQYSALTKQWLLPENKYDSMEHWTMEHVILGDVSDGVPKVVDHCEFSESFKQHLISHGINKLTPHEFKYTPDFNYLAEIATEEEYQRMLSEHNELQQKKLAALQTFTVQKKNRKGEDNGLDIYKDARFGSATLAKAIEKHGCLDAFLDSHPLYREHYERNFQLVMEEGIPEYIKEETLTQYYEAERNYNKSQFLDYLQSKSLGSVESLLIKVFKSQETISIDNCGW